MKNATTYRVTLPFATFRLRADFDRAGSDIEVNFDPDADDDSWGHTPYQAADARHDVAAAARLAVEHCGRDWYAEPGDEREDEDILDEVMAAAKVVAL